MPATEGSRYLGRTVYTYRDPLTGSAVQLMDRLVYTGSLQFDDDVFHTTDAGDTVDLLAHRYLGNSRWYWVICLVNNIFWPLALEPGTTLRIPSPSTFQSILMPRLASGREF